MLPVPGCMLARHELPMQLRRPSAACSGKRACPPGPPASITLEVERVPKRFAFILKDHSQQDASWHRCIVQQQSRGHPLRLPQSRHHIDAANCRQEGQAGRGPLVWGCCPASKHMQSSQVKTVTVQVCTARCGPQCPPRHAQQKQRPGAASLLPAPPRKYAALHTRGPQAAPHAHRWQHIVTEARETASPAGSSACQREVQHGTQLP